jgi:hypothetical protein
MIRSAAGLQRRRARRVLDLYPSSHAPAAIRQIAALRHDTLKAHLAGVLEDDRTVALDMLRQAHSGPPRDQPFQAALAPLKRLASAIFTVQFEQVERIQKDLMIVRPRVQLPGKARNGLLGSQLCAPRRRAG